MPVVSVVIPIWNTGPYLQECLESVLVQSLRDIEVVCVDDGSTDGSVELVSLAAGSDPRIRLIRQAHRGPGMARNRGMESATGTFIYFLDSDDSIAQTTLEQLVNRAEEAHADVVFFESVNAGRSKIRFNWNRHGQRRLAGQVCEGLEFMEPALRARVLRPSPCLQFIRRSLITENGLRYPDLAMAEDGVFTVHLCLAAKRVIYLPIALFHRRWRLGSLTTSAQPMESVRGTLSALKLIPRAVRDGPHAPSANRALKMIRQRHWRYALHQWDKLPLAIRKNISWEAVLEEDQEMSKRFLRAAHLGALERALRRMIQGRWVLPANPTLARG